ncbi:NAD(P)-dependent alcohol dehydrogenase [Candidatus Thalassolituus haligoni]|uniref:NAD(P)-dependent alcohol dehydrogenase n=1 Tax=Candidatus Thalassolituus haligoni TaxID=3100113 RepID=UPI0035174160|tara:strand:+ start:6396 stop:7448 length:1053 start_codon:yes stop_codon:yes gene_type:complete
MKTASYAAQTAESLLAPMTIERREPHANDVSIDILYCGVCHSDLHTARNDWGWTVYPAVPGHEIVGRVSAVGSEVAKYNIGDLVAVGCMVDSCQHCKPCHAGEEQYCGHRVDTYNTPDGSAMGHTMGGYSNHVVVREEFVLSVPENLETARVAPLVCAGITTYSPLRTWNVGPGSQVAVIGLGGLGHMAVKLAAAMGAHVTAITRSASKADEAKALGADAVLISTDTAAMKHAADRFELIIDTVPVKHDINPYMPLLELDGTLVIVGQVGLMQELHTAPMILGRRRVAGSLIGGVAETQEMLDFCGKTGVLPEVEMIRMDQINEAYERLEKSDVRYRFVIDMSSMPALEG